MNFRGVLPRKLTFSSGSLRSGHIAPRWQQPAAFDEGIPQNSQNAAGDLFRVLRGVINLRQALLGHEIPAIKNAVTLSLGIFDEFALTHVPWLDQCVISFYSLSEKSKLASGESSMRI